MKKILLFGLLFLGLSAFSQNTVTQKLIRATQKLSVDDTLKYHTSIIPLLDVAYTQYSADSTSWHKGYLTSDKYIRVSNNLNTTWCIMKILKNGLTKSDSTIIFVTPTQMNTAINSIHVNTDSLVHKGRTEAITGKKNFSQSITTLKTFIGTGETLTKDTTASVSTITNPNAWGMAISATSPYVGIQGVGTSFYGYGLSGQSPYLPILGCNLSTSGTGRRPAIGLRTNSAGISAQNDLGLDINYYLPITGWSDPSASEQLSAQISAVITDKTRFNENDRFEFRVLSNGTLTKRAELSSKGNLILNNITLNSTSAPTDSIGGEIYYGTDGTYRYFNSVSNTWQTMAGEPNLSRVYSITLPSASTVADRCSGAVSGMDYPTGWTIGAYSGNTHDLQITHNLNRRIVSVTVYSTSGSGDRLLINTAAYSGILAPDKNTLRIEGLATVLTPIVINIVFN
jgi:hypothetical protein